MHIKSDESEHSILLKAYISNEVRHPHILYMLTTCQQSSLDGRYYPLWGGSYHPL